MIAPSRRLRLLTLLTLSPFLLAILYLNTLYGHQPPGPGTWLPHYRKTSDLFIPNTSRRITKVSMLYGKHNPLSERALQSHRRHAERWGYGMEVLRNEISDGFWNKPAFLLELVIRELRKGDVDGNGERVEWLMYVSPELHRCLI
jgi:hypothetical protein